MLNKLLKKLTKKVACLAPNVKDDDDESPFCFASVNNEASTSEENSIVDHEELASDDNNNNNNSLVGIIKAMSGTHSHPGMKIWTMELTEEEGALVEEKLIQILEELKVTPDDGSAKCIQPLRSFRNSKRVDSNTKKPTLPLPPARRPLVFGKTQGGKLFQSPPLS